MGFYVRGINGDTRACTRAQALQIVRGMVMTTHLQPLLGCNSEESIHVRDYLRLFS